MLLKRLAAVEHRARQGRLMVRSWNREVRKLALEFAPELFGEMPDLLLPGSVMGDGGFAELARVPRRNYEDYSVDDAETDETTTAASASAVSGSGRKVLRGRRVDTGDMVSLKMFRMNNAAQRRALEHELSALGHLRRNTPGAHFVVSCEAVIDGCSYDLEQSEEKMAVYVEYPVYIAGNLEQWLRNKPREEWEQQSAAQHLLSALAFIHDHGLVHNAIRPTNILITEYGHPVLADFEQSRFLRPELSAGVGLGTIGGRGVPFQLPEGVSRNFVAPEIVSSGSESSSTYASDVYSFGVVMNYLYVIMFVTLSLSLSLPPILSVCPSHSN